MLEIFKHKKTETPNKILETENKIVVPDAVKIKKEVLANFLEEAQSIDVSNELAKNEIESVLGKNTEEFLAENITDTQIKAINSETESALENATNNKTILEKIRGLGHAAVLTAMLSLGINSSLAANEKGTDQGKNKTEQSSSKEKENVFVLSATNFFETDKAELINESELTKKFDDFLSRIDENNFQEVMAQEWSAKGSSDERKTLNWDGKNVNLTIARLQSFTKLLKETLAKHDFSKQLSKEHAEAILRKEILNSHPTAGAEEGVTYLTDLSKDDGKKYTKEEIAALSAEELQKLYEKCRYTNFEAELKMEKPGFSEVLNYDECVILVDNSPSMRNSQINMAGELQKLNGDKPVTVVYFSSEISATEERSNSKEAAEVMSKMPTKGSDNEKAISSAIEYLKKNNIKDGKDMPSRIMYIGTDEGIQDAEKTNELMTLAKQKNTTIKILMFYENGSKSVKIGLKEMNEKTLKIAENDIKLKQEKANLHLSVVTDRANTLIGRLVFNAKGNEDLRIALTNDGIELGDLAAAKEQVIHKNSRDFKSLTKVPQGIEAINVLRELEKARFTAAEAGELTVDSYLSKANIKITALEDEKGKTVNFPI